jgi:hypothetical protein
MQFVLRPDADHTLIEEEISFRSWLPVRPLMENIFRKQHQLLFRNIESS